MTNLLLCGCEPHGHKCLISEGGCGRCFEHCVCTPSGVASTGAGRAENNRRRSPVSTPAASPKTALHACAAEGGGSFTAPMGHVLSEEVTVRAIGGQTLADAVEKAMESEEER